MSLGVLLTDELARRRAKNPRYSLRSFARLLKIPPGRLSELLSGKRAFTEDHLARIADALALDPETRARLATAFVEGNHTLTLSDRFEAKHTLTADEFALIAEWPHYAILSLMHTRDFRPDPAWIARRLGLPPNAVRGYLARLERLGLVRRVAGGLKRTHAALKTSTDIVAPALRHAHRQSLAQAIEALDEVPLERRDVTSVTMAIDPSRLSEAKRKIAEFSRAMEALLESGPRTEVYNLNIQLVPVTRDGNGGSDARH
jgi:uncharacterized protein (TIGR02147 family)